MGVVVSGKNFIINASNANGVVNNRYRLRHLSDVSQTVPYSVTLQGDTDTVTLPNPVNKAVPFSTTGKTCFTPSFRTTVDPQLKDGAYSDVLTFTVVTKS
ncbi:hypothetical protein DIE19_03150 [Burkholderia sp. Bp9126]|nr:hypothetical protein DIE19_03150 [Burkholderia sp. Bp9126]